MVGRMLYHPFKPVYDSESLILILGTFPSPQSRINGFFYGNPRNRFWKILSILVNSNEVPKSIDEKIRFLLKNRIAVWDTVQSCDIKGANDSSIKNIIPTDLNSIIYSSKIKRIYANGNKAFQIYMKYCYSITNKTIIRLPSTSPANMSYSFEKLLYFWKNLINFDFL